MTLHTPIKKHASKKGPILAALCMLALVLVAGSLLYIHELNTLFERRSQQELSSVAQSVSFSVQSRLLSRAKSLDYFSKFISRHSRFDSPDAAFDIQRYDAQRNDIQIAITSDNRCFSMHDTLCNELVTENIFDKKPDTLSISGPYLSETLNEQYIILSSPIVKNEEIYGYVHSIEEIKTYEHIIKNIYTNDLITIYIVKKNGSVIASTNTNDQLKIDTFKNEKYSKIYATIESLNDDDKIVLVEEISNTPHNISISSLFDNTCLVITTPSSLEDQLVYRIIQCTILLLLAFVVIVLAMGFYLGLYRKSMSHTLKEINKELQFVIKNAPGGVIRTRDDSEGSLLFLSEGFLKMLGYSRAELRTLFNDKLISLIHDDDVSGVIHELAEQLAFGDRIETEYRLCHKSGTWLWVLQKGQRIVSRHGKGIYSTIIDITEHKQLTEQSLINAESLSLLLDISGNSLFNLDLKQNTISFSNQYSAHFGWPQRLENFPQSAYDADLIFKDDIAIFQAFVDKLYTGSLFSTAEVRLCDTHGKYRWASLAATVVFNKYNDAVKVIGKIEDINKQKNSIAALREQNLRDGFTGLYNKKASEELITEALVQTKDALGALFVVDVDNFKNLNDTLGHPVGDQALQYFSTQLTTIFRSADIVGRLGGDEFIIFMRNVREYRNFAEKADVICQTFRKAYGHKKQKVHLSASVGIAVFPEHGEDYATLYARADSALYAAKRNGKDQFCISSDNDAQESS